MKVLVVGAGSIGQRHIANIMSFRHDVEISVVEPIGEAAARIRSNHNLPTFASLPEALADESYDAAFICSPNHLHLLHATELARGGCHLFIEKPLCLPGHDLSALAECVNEKHCHTMVACNLRFHPGVKAIADALQSDIIGRPLYARAHFAHFLPNWRPNQDYRETYSAKAEQGGGILIDAIHEPDYLCWLLGDVVQVGATTINSGQLELEVEDIASYTLRHRNGALSQVHVDYLRHDKMRGCDLVGSDGTLTWQSAGKNPERVFVKLYRASSREWVTLVDDASYEQNTQYLDQLQYFFQCLEHDIEPMNGLGEAYRLIDVMGLLQAAADSGQIQNV